MLPGLPSEPVTPTVRSLKHDIAELTALVKTRSNGCSTAPSSWPASSPAPGCCMSGSLTSSRDRGEPFVEVTLLGHRAPLPCASEANHGIQRLGVLLVIAASGRTRPGRRRAPRSAVAERGALQTYCVGQAMERTLDRSAPVWLLAAASVSTMARSTSPPCSLISREVSAAR